MANPDSLVTAIAAAYTKQSHPRKSDYNPCITAETHSFATLSQCFTHFVLQK